MLRSRPRTAPRTPRDERGTSGLRAMTAALVIVPTHSASARTASAQGGPSSREAGGTRATRGEVPWMVRLSMGCGGTTGSAAQSVLTAQHSTGSTGHSPAGRIPSAAEKPADRPVARHSSRYRAITL
ncbi:hypothetical protein FB561_2101 [Kribbella amoyensis]|uniref:Uncharacterized protein n=1 Tax=Kribbella amoyensis TaxID=996641 RepID=A0A561BQ33_9ACTN|nr:hypothetical protein FB561_2101 [Kribbella amoyensis]